MNDGTIRYSRDYHRLCQSAMVSSDFERGLLSFLLRLGVPEPASVEIASETCARMQGLRYHTPLHILSIYDWADEQSIPLEAWQTLALWFHDVIYDLKAPPLRNEEQSAQFAQQKLVDHVDPALLARACEAIRCTGRHLETGEFPEGVALILDLDICMFAWDRPNYTAAAQAVAEEYQSLYSPAEYAIGRKKFLYAFRGKGFIFRTPALQRYETVALENIAWEMANLG